MRNLIIIVTLLTLLTFGAANASSGQTVTGSFQCDIEFYDGELEATNCEVFDLEIR